ncbi:MAG: hypothetical protein J6A15_09930 [Clostridia bacterium]|nr:hypothetical protein [Clostridia bacterium]
MIRLTHRYEIRDGIPQIVIYAYTPVEYEFAMDFDTIRRNAVNTVGKIREYAQEKFSNVNNSTVMLIVNGVIIGSVALTNLLAK